MEKAKKKAKQRGVGRMMLVMCILNRTFLGLLLIGLLACGIIGATGAKKTQTSVSESEVYSEDPEYEEGSEAARIMEKLAAFEEEDHSVKMPIIVY